MNDAKELFDGLTLLSAALRAQPNKTRFSDHWSWQAPPLNTEDLALITDQLSQRVGALRWETEDEQRAARLASMSAAVLVCHTTTVPNLFSGFQAIDSIMSVLFAVEKTVEKLSETVDFRLLSVGAQLIKRKAGTANARLTAAVESIDGIDKKLTDIETAYQAAEDLPFTQKQLTEALREVELQQKAAQKHEIAAGLSAAEAALKKVALDKTAEDVENYLSNIKDAYRAVTSQGLAQAFRDREHALNRSMLIWVLGLLAALSAAGIIGAERFPHVIAAVTGKPEWGVVLVNVTLAAFTVAPAVWFAWVSTKQIGQRFRLAEDYAYKAAISAAYEGYRLEAARLDPLLEAQLFASALARLDELPLRLIEQNVAGSPLQDLIKSIEFKQAADSIPGFMERVLSVLKRTSQTDSNTGNAKAKLELVESGAKLAKKRDEETETAS